MRDSKGVGVYVLLVVLCSLQRYHFRPLTHYPLPLHRCLISKVSSIIPIIHYFSFYPSHHLFFSHNLINSFHFLISKCISLPVYAIQSMEMRFSCGIPNTREKNPRSLIQRMEENRKEPIGIEDKQRPRLP